MPPMNTILQGVGIDSTRILGLAERVGLPLRAPDGVAERVITLWQRDTNTESFDWRPPATSWIETSDLTDDALAVIVRRSAEFELFASLTTTTANDLQIAEALVDAVSAVRAIAEARRQDIALALHEAVSNAIIHGNLRIGGLRKLSMDDLEVFSRMLGERLSDPAFAHRRIEIQVRLQPNGFTVDILDEGNGYALDSRGSRGVNRASGRGLELIGSIARHCEPLDNGRRLRMEFDW